MQNSISSKGTTGKVFFSLGSMIFLQYLMLAVWWVPLAAYLANLGLSGFQKSLILSSMAIGSMTSPIIGMIADRYFASEKVLIVLNFFSAIFLVAAANIQNPNLLFVILILIMLAYMPTWSLTSSISMAHTSAEQFPRIRVFGSVGWVASGLFSLVAVQVFNVEIFDGSKAPFYCGAAISIIAALQNLTLPSTPPVAKGEKATIIDTLGFRAFYMLKDRNFCIFMILSFLSIIPFSLYHVFGSEFLQSQNFQFITFTMNLGQVVEIFFMIVATTIIVKAGIKWALIIGLFALVLRYLSFYFGGILNENLFYILGILVHGVIFGLLYVGGQVYTDRKAPKELKAQAQGFLAFMVWGVGLFLGIIFNGWLIGYHSRSVDNITKYNWDAIFGLSGLMSVIILFLFIMFFRNEK
ncbi:MFS transporter [uncultured Draconibacterium sp.]|uniref:MFS transporter n=1 Tax=uncultured Draconibacterium sp. TaxID=1573823 RepID=UPI0025F88D91|nr:MFS transporter [uncultured Draconibacterium sp.]